MFKKIRTRTDLPREEVISRRLTMMGDIPNRVKKAVGTNRLVLL